MSTRESPTVQESTSKVTQLSKLCRPQAASLCHLMMCIAAVCLPVPPAGAAEAGPKSPPSDGHAVAWVRFDKAEEAYAGEPYLWLGRTTIRLTVDVAAAAGHVLELRWGSKKDTRSAAMTINGHELTLRHGGYEGFRWLRVPVPKAVSAAGGTHYEVVLRRTHDKPAFFSAVRLVAPGKPAAAPPYAKAAAHRVALKTAAASRPTAFPDMRKIWDTPLPPAAKPLADADQEAAFRAAELHARQANEMLWRCRKFVAGWLTHADEKTGLIPRNLSRGRDVWNAKDAAADNYPFMVLTCALTDRRMFRGRMLDMLRTETKLTSRLGRLPDTWSFSKQAFASEKANLGGMIFGGSEYVKDGLLPLTEWLGPSPWSERMIGILDDIFRYAPVDTPGGKIPSTNVEVNGEMLQSLSRVYWMTGERKYLDWAVRLGDYYLLGDHHPTRNFRSLRLRDHGCEIVSGLSEVYAAVAFTKGMEAKRKAYRQPIHAVFDRILEVARDARGMLYNTIDPQTGKHARGICDTWGYNYNGVYTVHLIDDKPAYRQAVRKVLGNLEEHLTEYNWGSADEFADSIEGAINLYNREPVASAGRWIDSEIKDMWAKQRPDGVIEGWHGDGNSARTAIMYALWKTQGLTVQPWRADVRFGAVRRGETLLVSLYAGGDKPWRGKLVFDKPRHKVQMHLPLDYPRINQFPQWFTPEAHKRYEVRDLTAGTKASFGGEQLQAGLALELKAGAEVRLILAPAPR